MIVSNTLLGPPSGQALLAEQLKMWLAPVSAVINGADKEARDRPISCLSDCRDLRYNRRLLGCAVGLGRVFTHVHALASLLTMTTDAELKKLSLSGIRHRCAEESDRFFHRQSYDPAFCYEMFRRAILEQDERAWELVMIQYRPLVTGWVRRHGRFSEIDEDVSYVMNGAFARLWQYLKPDRFDEFPDLPSILKYLQMCVNSVIEDAGRKMEYTSLLDDLPLEATTTNRGSRGSAVEERVFSRVQRHDFWLQVSERLKNEKEWAVMHGRFVLGLKPRELCRHYPELFGDVAEVYRVKENVMDRLRRDLELATLVGEL